MRYQDLNILIACEESQTECLAFLAYGCNVYSCDIQPCRRGGRPDRHIQGDVTPYLQGRTSFTTMDGVQHAISHWHLIIAHPPCTYLCRLSSCQLVVHGVLNEERLRRMIDAAAFFRICLDAHAEYVCVENPVPMRRAGLPTPSCYVQPYWYGHKYSKKTCYWLKNLPPLMPTIINPHFKCYVTSSRGKYRSRTFAGVANAMAAQWLLYILASQE